MLDDIDPIKFTEKNFTLQGKQFIILGQKPEEARHYLRELYNMMVFKLPRIKKPLVIVKGRQVEMTTTIANIIAYYVSNYDFFDVLYAAPKSDQAKTFSDTRIDPLQRYKSNPEVMVPLKDGTYNKSVKQYTNGSTLYIHGTGDQGDHIRGISVQALIKDEYQDFDPSSENAIDEILTHSKDKINISLGTPKDSGSRFEQRWKNQPRNTIIFPARNAGTSLCFTWSP